MQTLHQPTPPLDALSLMQTVSPAHMELQMLQAALEAMPLITQATRARMLGHRLAERYTTAHQLPDAAAGMRALLAVFEEGVPTQKLCPMDTDHQWVRDRWAVISGTLPEPVLREEGPVEVEDSQSKEEDTRASEVNHTDMAHQRAFAANLEAAAALRREEQACLEQALREVPASSAQAPAVVAPEARPGKEQVLVQQPEDRRFHLWVQRATIRGGAQRDQGVAIKPGETVRLQFELRVEDSEGMQQQREHQAPPQTFGDAAVAAEPGQPQPENLDPPQPLRRLRRRDPTTGLLTRGTQSGPGKRTPAYPAQVCKADQPTRVEWGKRGRTQNLKRSQMKKRHL